MDYAKLSAALSKMLASLRQRDIAGLRKLGSSLGEVALVENEELYVEVAIGAYAIAKLLEKPHFAEAVEWKKAFPKIEAAVEQALAAAGSEKGGEAGKKVLRANSLLEKAAAAAGRFQMSVLEKARIKIGADIYAHGASLGRACALSGASKQKLLPYLGNTKLADKYQTIPSRERLATALKLFAIE